METRDRGREHIESDGQTMTRKIFSGIVLTMALLVAGAGALRGQETPEPSGPPESGQVFVLNDGAAHLGVTLGEVTAEKAQALKLPAVAGALVTSVQKDSAAAKAGIGAGDAIMEFDGVHVRSSAELRRLIRETPAGRTVDMKVVRDGKSRVLRAKLEATANNFTLNGSEMNLPSVRNVPEIHVPPMDFSELPSIFGGHRATLGISADDLTPQLAQYFGAKQGKGVLVSEVTKGGAADKAGLKAGDVIVQVDGKPVSGVEELRAALNDNFTGDTRKVSLTIVRDHREQTVTADLTRPQPLQRHTSSTVGQTDGPALAEIQAQAKELRAQASQMQAQADSQRALVQSEVLKQKQQVQGEWQRELQEQMRALKDQLKQMQDLQVTQHQDGEI